MSKSMANREVQSRFLMWGDRLWATQQLHRNLTSSRPCPGCSSTAHAPGPFIVSIHRVCGVFAQHHTVIAVRARGHEIIHTLSTQEDTTCTSKINNA